MEKPVAKALVVAVGTYDHHEPLPKAVGAAVELADEFEKGGCTVEDRSLIGDCDHTKLGSGVAKWLESIPEQGRLILYWTGHGVVTAAGHYLIARNSPKDGLSAFNAVEARAIGTAIAQSKAEKILVILDTCYSGQGAADIAGVFSQILATRVEVAGEERAVAVIASAHPVERAEEAVFGKALKKVLFDRAKKPRWTDEDQFIHSEFLSRAIKSELGSNEASVSYKADGLGQDFIPNPRYRAGLIAEDVETRRRLLDAGEDHFERSSRGIEVDETGWYFSGRVELLSELVSWLKSTDDSLLIVTGPPGAGKSAVLGRLAILSDPVLCRTAEKLGGIGNAPVGTVPPENSIDVAIHAKGKNLDDCARAIATKLNIQIEATTNVETLIKKIGQVRRRITILLDALDEAAGRQGEKIARDLIVPLAKLDNVKVLVGSRRSLDGATIPEGEDRHARLRRAFGDTLLIRDLDDAGQTEDDIAAYVRQRLLDSQHKTKLPAIDEAARTIARRAKGIFLYARVVARTLQDEKNLDVTNLPATALGAFVDDLKRRFGKDEVRVDELLAALAWAEGKGLTRRVWPVIATALARSARKYADDDILWVLSHAGWHIVETGEDGQTVYRLVHQAFNDHYRNKIEVGQANGLIAAAFIRSIKGASWLGADRYLWRYLADHAADAGQLDKLVTDPGYLATAEPSRLLAALETIKGRKAHRYADIYRRTAGRLHDLSPIGRMPYIHMTAQMEQPKLASTLNPPVPTRWCCRWARCRQTTPNRIVGKHSGPVTSVVLGEVNGKAVVVSGSDDRTIQLWDPSTSKPVGGPLSEAQGEVKSVAFGQVNGLMVVVAGFWDGSIRLWDATTCRPISAPVERHVGAVNSIALGEIDDRLVVVSGGDDRTIRLWDALTGRPIGKPLEGHTKSVTSVTIGEINGQKVVISGSEDTTVRMWGALTATSTENVTTREFWPLIGAKGDEATPAREYRHQIAAVSFGSVRGRATFVSAHVGGTITLRDATTGKMIAQFEGRIGSVIAVLSEINRRAVLISESNLGGIQLWNVSNGNPIGEPLQNNRSRIETIALGKVDGKAVMISGSNDGAIRMWDLSLQMKTKLWKSVIQSPLWNAFIGIPNDGSFSELKYMMTSVVAGAISNRMVIVTGGWDDKVRMWDALSGRPMCEPLVGHDDTVTSIALGAVNRQIVIASGSADKTIRLWYAPASKWWLLGEISRLYKWWVVLTHKLWLGPLRGHEDRVNCVALTEIDGRKLVASGSDDQTVRVWDFSSGRLIGVPLKGHLQRVTKVAFGDVGGRALVVAGSRDGTIRMWDALSGKQHGDPFIQNSGVVRFVAIDRVDGRGVVTSVDFNGVFRLWDVSTGELLRESSDKLSKYSRRWVESVALGEKNIALVDNMGSLQICDRSDFAETIEIELDESLESVALLGNDSVVVVMARGGLARIDFSEKFRMAERIAPAR